MWKGITATRLLVLLKSYFILVTIESLCLDLLFLVKEEILFRQIVSCRIA
jgi:hypothetical protein